jgi:hypothetical protein
MRAEYMHAETQCHAQRACFYASALSMLVNNRASNVGGSAKLGAPLSDQPGVVGIQYPTQERW